MPGDHLLARVAKPARYLGGEYGQVRKDPAGVRLWFALAFPEVYEIAMSHLGLRILYEALAGRPEVAAERVCAPWTDLWDLLAAEGSAPWSLESGRPLDRFDVIGFSLQYELTYTNLLGMLQLAGIPLRREARGLDQPLVIAGGPCAMNPEPLADFLDLVVLGEAEELIHPLCDLFLAAKEGAWPREELYRRAAALAGVYVPALHVPDGRGGLRPKAPAPVRVRRRVLADLAAVAPPARQVVPSVAPVHDRLGIEIARGCTRGCRFCQAGYIYRPVRERPAEGLKRAALAGLAHGGYDELALLSLSSGDYTCIEPLAAALMDALETRRVGLSLPSLRVESLSPALIAQIKRVRKTGFTLAPEAGSERLRRSINKGFSDRDILATARAVYGLGWNLVKLYFMVGLPGETDEDLLAIGRLCRQVADQAGRRRGKVLVHASLGVFVPKAHTPFQWEGQVDLAEARRRLALAKGGIDDPRVKCKWNSPEQSLLEGILARGDRRLGRALELALAKGCRFDGWSEELRLEAWLLALAEAGLTPGEYLAPRDPDAPLAWDHLDSGVAREYLLAERERAREGLLTSDCRQGECLGCGVCDFREIMPRLAPEPPAIVVGSAVPPIAAEAVAYRFRLAKTGPARYLGHLETMAVLERALRRAGAPLAYSQGFHPHAQVKTQSALPLGVESLVEVLEVKLTEAREPGELANRVNQCLPEGLCLADGRRRHPGESLAEPGQVSYLVTPPQPLDPDRLAAFAARESLDFVRATPKGERRLDLKAAVRELGLEADGRLRLTVGRAGGRPKPAEVLMAVFGLSEVQAGAARALKVGTVLDDSAGSAGEPAGGA